MVCGISLMRRSSIGDSETSHSGRTLTTYRARSRFARPALPTAWTRRPCFLASSTICVVPGLFLLEAKNRLEESLNVQFSTHRSILTFDSDKDRHLNHSSSPSISAISPDIKDLHVHQ